MVPAEILIRVVLAIAKGKELHHEVRERLRQMDLRLGRLPVGARP